MYEYRAQLVRVHDGDTIFVDLDLGFHSWLHATRDPEADEDKGARLARINAPELRVIDLATRHMVDNPAGIASRDALAAYLQGKTITIQSIRDDKYGRYLVEVYADGVNVNDWLVANGFALYWDGSGPKPV